MQRQQRPHPKGSAQQQQQQGLVSNRSSKGGTNFLTKDIIQSLSSCLAYSVASNSMVLVNRYLVAPRFFGFHEKTFVIFIQAFIAVVMLEIAKQYKLVHYESFKLSTARKWAPVTIFFVLMLYTSTQATAGLPIHLVVVFKNLTNVGIVFGERVFFKEPISGMVLGSLFLMLFGALMAAYADAQEQTQQSTIMGYVWMLANCVCTAGYVLYMRYATSRSSLKLPKFGMAFYNNLISMVLLCPMMTFSGDAITVWSSPLLTDKKFLLCLFLSGVLGVGLNLASFWCVSVNTATTYATVGALKELPTPFVGVFLLHEVLDPATGMYVFFGLAGGIMYGYAKYAEKMKSKTMLEMKTKKQQPEPPEKDSMEVSMSVLPTPTEEEEKDERMEDVDFGEKVVLKAV